MTYTNHDKSWQINAGRRIVKVKEIGFGDRFKMNQGVSLELHFVHGDILLHNSSEFQL